MARIKYILLISVLVFVPITVLDAMVDDPLGRPEVNRALNQFLTRERAFIQRGLDNASLYVPVVKEILTERGLPEDLVWLPLIESAYSYRAYSPRGAAGMWQFMPSTARWYDLKIDFWVDERRDPFKSTKKAAQHLGELHRYYGSWELALAAYNAGMGAVNRAIKAGKSRDYWKLCRKGLLSRETRWYVPRFLAACEIGNNPYKYDFHFDESEKYPDFEVLDINRPVDLTILATRSGFKTETIRFLNPELRRLLTPFGRNYELRIPFKHYADALAVYHDLPAEELTGVKRYRVRSGETISEIAEKFDTSVYLIKLLNGVRNPKRLDAGRVILIPVESDDVVIDEWEFLPKKGFYTQEIYYTIRDGDTLWEIAGRYRTDVETILAVNGLSFDSTIRPGDEIALWIDTVFCK
ncbi:MAG: LysM peptidoglycan-binding domain-containing protein [Spirochaetota bacterium]|nr:MAG: LysM peptidoglycan-binding domain-containing protein [Spirochaetota bacterium]